MSDKINEGWKKIEAAISNSMDEEGLSEFCVVVKNEAKCDNDFKNNDKIEKAWKKIEENFYEK